MHKYLEIGKIKGPHGIKGEIILLPFTDNHERYKKIKSAFVNIEGNLKKIEIEQVRLLSKSVLIKIEGIDNRDEAEKLKGLHLEVAREEAVSLNENEYFVCDILGSRVYKTDGTLIGILCNVIETGSNDVYEVSTINGKKILIPALKSVVLKIVIDEGIIIVKLPEGLDEI